MFLKWAILYSWSFRLDRNSHECGILLYFREDILQNV